MPQTVLVIDDEPDILFTVRLILQLEGYRVLEAATGEEALALYAREAPDALLLDVSLPDMDGWEVLRRLRVDEGLDPSRVVMLSAHVGRSFSQTAEREGCRGYISKPFQTEDVLDALGAAASAP